ncbi:MAG: tetratricopeptide repeat protein [Firmicutes bacterium]|nr:tetratricopeptide repeat protein [Bacillota bacterium]
MKKAFQEKLRGVSLLAVAGGLFFVALGLRYKFGNVFYSPESGRFSSDILAKDFIHPIIPISGAFFKLIPEFGAGYLVPVFLLLMPSIFLFCSGINLIFPEVWEKIRERWRGKPALFAGGAVITGFILIMLVQHFILFNYTYVCDEFSYSFQADMLKNGQLYVQSPPMNNFFKFANTVCLDKWYSRYTIGFPLLLMSGKVMGIPSLVNPLLSCGTIILLFLAGKELGGEKAGITAAFMAAFSPTFLILGATYFAHSSEVFFSLLFCYCVFWIMQKADSPALLPASIAAFSAAIVLLIRPGSGAAVFAGGIIPLCYRCIFAREKRLILPSVIITLGALAGAGVLLGVNQAQTGNMLTFAFGKYRETETVGFINGHTPLKGLWNFICLSMKGSFWVFPIILTGAVATIIRRKNLFGVFTFPAVLFAALYFMYPSTGQVEFGARFYLAAVILLIPLAASGVYLIFDFLRDRFKIQYAGQVGMWVAAAGIFTIVSVIPSLMTVTRAEYGNNKGLRSFLLDPKPGSPEKFITFIRTAPNNHSFVYTINTPYPEKQKNICVLYLSPVENIEFMKQYPDRTPLVMNFSQTAGFGFEPYNRDIQPSASDYIAAGINYRISVFDNEKAENLLFLALSLEPENAQARFQLGTLLFEKREYEKALQMFMKIKNTEPDSLYYAGKCYSGLGDIKQAARCMKEYLEKYPNREKSPAAQDRLKYYSERE